MHKPTIKQLIDSEIADFAAALGQPGCCETPEAIQAELLKRFAHISAEADRYILELIGRISEQENLKHWLGSRMTGQSLDEYKAYLEGLPGNV